MTDNELIAEFMGTCHRNNRVYINGRGGYVSKHYPHTLKYHNNWSWLMPVVEKIEKLGYTVYIFDNHCKIWEQSADPNKDPIAHGWSGNIEDSEKIAGTHQAVVEFINWHNSQK